MDRDSIHEYLLICGRNSFVLAFVSAGNQPGDNKLVLFGKNVVDGEMQIGKSGHKPDNLPFVTFRTCLRAGQVGVVESMAGGNQLVYDDIFSEQDKLVVSWLIS